MEVHINHIIFLQSKSEKKMMDTGDQFGVGAVFQEYGEHLAAEGEVKELLRGTTRLTSWRYYMVDMSVCDFRELEVASREVHSLLQRVHRLSRTFYLIFINANV